MVEVFPHSKYQDIALIKIVYVSMLCLHFFVMHIISLTYTST